MVAYSPGAVRARSEAARTGGASMERKEPPTPASAAGPSGIQDEIRREHEALRALLARIENTRLLSDLVPLLATLRAELEEHFVTEERPEGLHAAVVNQEPRYMHALEVILHEHREFLHEADELLARSRACLEQKENILRDVLRLSHRLHEHESRETALLTNTLYIDLGRS